MTREAVSFAGVQLVTITANKGEFVAVQSRSPSFPLSPLVPRGERGSKDFGGRKPRAALRLPGAIIFRPCRDSGLARFARM
jgi:hypothetical protein